MHRFTVWSPDAQDVALQLYSPAESSEEQGAPMGDRIPMSRNDSGWWEATVEAAGPGTDYAYSIDGGMPFPDPRSAWQPYGVHGPSRLHDASAHQWKDLGWKGSDARGRLFYELHIGTFTPEGTLDAAIGRLDHLVELGVDVVELMPVAAFPGVWGWGYDGVALYAVHHPYGGPDALQRFVDAAHQRGMAVCLDVVYNHLGPSGNYLGTYAPYFTTRHTTPWGPAVNLDDTGSHEVRRFICDNALRWMRDFHIDALRLDAVHELRDDSPTHILAQLAAETDALAAELGRPLTLVAESDLNEARMVMPASQGGHGIHAQWNDDFHHALHSMLTNEKQGYYVDFGDLATFAQVLRHVFFHAGTYSTFRGREWGAEVDPAKVGGHQFLAFASNHDQVGNRAIGDRPAHALSPGMEAISAALVLTSPFTPMLFMGEEWSASTPFNFFTDHPEPELAQAVREGRRNEFAHHGWSAQEVPDPQDRATRDLSVLRWEELDQPDHRAMLEWVRTLVRLRREEPDLQADDLREVGVHFDVPTKTLAIHRGSIHVLVNLSDAVQDMRAATLEDTPLRAGVPLTQLAVWGTFETAHGSVTLSKESVAVVRAG